MAAPQVALFEIEAWEAEYLRGRLPNATWLTFPGPLAEEQLPLLAEAEVISPFIYSRLDAAALARLPRLRLVPTRSTGYDHVDVAACKAHGVAVANVPSYGENTVAEHTFALILALSRKLLPSVERTRKGRFDPAGLQGFDLKDKTLGVVGAGHIGQHVVRMAHGFEMRVVVHDPRQDPELAASLGFRYVPLDELLQESDVISLHAPYLPATHHLINRGNIGRIKRGAVLVNTSRGGLLETEALVQALQEGILAGAGLDVLEEEGLVREEMQVLSRDFSQDQLKIAVQNHMLLLMENVIVTPHNAFHSGEARRRILDTTVENIQSFLAGAPVNLVG